MKRFIFVMLAIALVTAVGTGTASAAAADNSLQQGNMSVSVGMGDSIFGTTMNDVIDLSGRYLITNDMAIIAGFGFRTNGGDADASYFSFMGGVRKYFKTGEFAPFFGGQLKVVLEEDDAAAPPEDRTVFDLSAMVGAEYFFGKQFSVEGAIGLGFGQITDDNGVTETDDRYFGTRTTGIRANFYF